MAHHRQVGPSLAYAALGPVTVQVGANGITVKGMGAAFPVRRANDPTAVVLQPGPTGPTARNS